MSPTASQFEAIASYTTWRQAVMPLLGNHELVATGPLLRDPGRRPTGLLINQLTPNPRRTGAAYPPLGDWIAVAAPGGEPPADPAAWVQHLEPRFAQLLVVLLVGFGRNRSDWRGWTMERGVTRPLAGLRIVGPKMVHAVAVQPIDFMAESDAERWSRVQGVVGAATFAKLRETSVAVIGCSRSGICLFESVGISIRPT